MTRAILIYLASASAALAHPGHGEPMGHWLRHADHVAAYVIAAMVVAGAAYMAYRRSRE